MTPTSRDAPAYVVGSVDNALRLAVVLQTEGALRITDAAARLGVAPSTAHRLLTTLVHRDFAVQRPDRSYVAGPALSLPRAPEDGGSLRALVLPVLGELVERLNESANVQVLRGRHAVAIAGVEAAQVLRVGSREGATFPAHLSSGGKVLLAELPDDALRRLFDPGDAEAAEVADLAALRAALSTVRASGFAMNQGRTEPGVSAVGTAVRDGSGEAVAAVSVSVPTVRFVGPRVRSLQAGLTWAAQEMGRRLAQDRPATPRGATGRS